MNLTSSLNTGSATLNNALKNMRILWEETKRGCLDLLCKVIESLISAA